MDNFRFPVIIRIRHQSVEGLLLNLLLDFDCSQQQPQQQLRWSMDFHHRQMWIRWNGFHLLCGYVIDSLESEPAKLRTLRQQDIHLAQSSGDRAARHVFLRGQPYSNTKKNWRNCIGFFHKKSTRRIRICNNPLWKFSITLFKSLQALSGFKDWQEMKGILSKVGWHHSHFGETFRNGPQSLRTSRHAKMRDRWCDSGWVVTGLMIDW